MIEEIEFNGIATYSKDEKLSLKKINYIYGKNGSGKTTISNLILNPEKFVSKINWVDNKKIDTLVYNKKFINTNFEDKSKIKGIFTLGEESKEITEQIEKLFEEETKITNTVDLYNKKIRELISSREMEKDSLNSIIWEDKSKYADKVKKLFDGQNVLGSKENFCNYIMNADLSIDLMNYDDIKKEYDLLYSDNLELKSTINIINVDNLNTVLHDQIFSEKIEGSKDISLSNLIDKMNNSNWVKEGIQYLEKSDDKCPFCQKGIDENLISNLNNYFNEDYSKKLEKISCLKETYLTEKALLIEYIKIIEEIPFFINDNAILSNFEMNLERNTSIINEKIDDPTKIVQFEGMQGLLNPINEKIKLYNEQNDKDNKKIGDIKNSKEALQKKIVRFIHEESNSVISAYTKKINGLNNGITILNDNILKSKERKESVINERKKLENSIKGIISTIDEINKILDLFGFKSFKLKASDEKGKYEIIRYDGAPVRDTLSEGEASFISFLYFYHLIKGSQQDDGIINDKIIVIDDPISSLDGETIFIITTLIKEIINDCFERKNGVRQIIILSHNVYFYKEITYRGIRDNKKEKTEGYFQIKKINEISSIEESKDNPIKSSYQILWEQLKDEKSSNNPYLCNTMRRILEQYFNNDGGINYEDIINGLEGEEKVVCKSLLSFINEGSHSIYDDFSVIFDNEKYLNVFKKVFEISNHLGHYEMMMSQKK